MVLNEYYLRRKPTVCWGIVLVLFSSLALAQAPPAGPSGSASRADLIRQRQDWFYSQRAYPLPRIPAGARLRALQELDQTLRTEGRQLSGSVSPAPKSFRAAVAASPTQWTLIGPQPVGFFSTTFSGRVTALAVDPGNANVVYLGAAEGGVWKTTDGGSTWTPLTDFQPSIAVGSIALDPSNSSIVYVGTGEENFNGDAYYGAGILKSINGGSTWTQWGASVFGGPSCGGCGGSYIGSVAVHPTNGQIVLAGLASPDGVFRSTDGGQTWTHVLSTGPVTGVLFDPTNGNIAYAASVGNGVYKSGDGGATWAKADAGGTNKLPTANVGQIALAIAPSHTSTLFAGIENTAFGSHSFLGFFKSTDGGANWSQLTNTPDYCNPQCQYDNVIAVSPADANVVYVGGFGLDRTLDGGASWADVTYGPNGELHVDQHALAFSAGATKLYAGDDGGAWSTTDINQTTLVPSPGALSFSFQIGGSAPAPQNLAVSSRNGSVLSYSVDASNDCSCMTVSPGSGTTPSAISVSVNLNGLAAETYYEGITITANGATNSPVNVAVIITVTTSTTSPPALVASPGEMSFSVQQGGSATALQNLTISSNGSPLSYSVTVSNECYCVTVSPGSGTTPSTLSVSVDMTGYHPGGPVYFWVTITANGASNSPLMVRGEVFVVGDIPNVSWSNLNSTLAITQFYPGLSIHPSNVNVALGGTQDNGTEEYTGNLKWNWIWGTCGDGGWAAFDTSTPTTMYASCQGFHIFKSTDSGSNWSPAVNGLDGAEGELFIPPFVIDPTHPANLYYGTYRVYQTTNGAGNWTPISPDLTSSSFVVVHYDFLTTIAVAPSDSNTVYAGTSNSKVQVTTNALSGATWTDRSAGLPPRYVTQITVDPATAQTAYVTFSGFSGFNGDTKGHVFKTTNGGANWNDISANLPNIPVNDLVVDPDLGNTLYVATDIGVFITSNGGSSWSSLATGLPRVAVLSLKLHRPSRTLRAATHGRSVWDILVPAKKRRGQTVSE